MSIAAQAPALRANRAVLAIVNRIDRNTRAVAKLASAIQWLEFDGRGSSELHLALFDVVTERRRLRSALEAELGWTAGQKSA